MQLQLTDKQPITSSALLEHFRNTTKNNKATTRAYQAAAVCFCAYAEPNSVDVVNLTEQNISDWVAYMWANGIKTSTATHYIDILSSMYSAAYRAGVVSEKPKFSDIRKSLATSGIHLLPDAITVTRRLQQFMRKKSSPNPEIRMAEDMLRISLLEPQMTSTAIASLTIDTPLTYSGQIAEKYTDHRRKYLFPIKRTNSSKQQQTREVAALIKAALANNTLDVINREASASETVATLRFMVAVSSGIPANIAVSATQSQTAMSLLPRCTPMPEIDANGINDRIAEALNSDKLNWYAMRLRHNVDYKDITLRINQIKDEMPAPQLFYPCQEIAKRIGRRLVYREHPLITDVVFFRSRPSDLSALFNKIGDLAWCYSSRQPDGTYSYSAISRVEMEQFQSAIGIFTPDINVYPIGTLIPEPGEQVIVIGGPLVGHIGTFSDTVNDKNGETLFRLILPGNNGIEWRASLNPNLVKKLNKTQ